MKNLSPLFWSVALAAGMAAGCGHLDLSPQDDADRVLKGTVAFNGGAVLPDEAVVDVRVVDAVPPPAPVVAPGDTTLKRPVPPPDSPPEVLGEKTIQHPGTPPIPFEVEYHAEVDQLQRGLNIEVRVSYDGRVRYYNRNGFTVGLNDYTLPHTVWVDAVSR